MENYNLKLGILFIFVVVSSLALGAAIFGESEIKYEYQVSAELVDSSKYSNPTDFNSLSEEQQNLVLEGILARGSFGGDTRYVQTDTEIPVEKLQLINQDDIYYIVTISEDTYKKWPFERNLAGFIGVISLFVSLALIEDIVNTDSNS